MRSFSTCGERNETKKTLPDKYYRSLSRAGFTHVIAGAALTPTLSEEEADPARIISVNFGGFVNCIEFARNTCTAARFIHISSDAVREQMRH